MSQEKIDDLHRKLGVKQSALDDLNVEYDRLLVYFSKIASGEIKPSQVVVNLAARSWVVLPPEAITAKITAATDTTSTGEAAPSQG